MGDGSGLILHITTETEWQRALMRGDYVTDSLRTEGFIHCSTFDQVAGVASRYFSGQTGLVLLLIDASRLKATLKYEVATGGDSFPHLYGPLNLDAVLRVADFPLQPDGTFKFSFG